MRMDSGFWSAKTIRACRRHQIRSSITVRQTEPIRAAIAAIDEDVWVQIIDPDGGLAQVAETRYKGDRLIVRRTRLTGAQAELFPNWRYHALSPTESAPPSSWTKITAATPRSSSRSATSKPASGLQHCPSGKFAANAALARDRHLGAQPAALGRRHRAGRPSGAGGGQDAAPDPAGPARSDHPLGSPAGAASARRLAVGGVVCAGAGPAALRRLRHLTHAAAQPRPQTPSGQRAPAPKAATEPTAASRSPQTSRHGLSDQAVSRRQAFSDRPSRTQVRQEFRRGGFRLSTQRGCWVPVIDLPYHAASGRDSPRTMASRNPPTISDG